MLFVCVGEEEGEGEKEDDRERERERGRRRVCSCSIVTNSRLLFILACDSQQPPHIRCEIGGEGEGEEAETEVVMLEGL